MVHSNTAILKVKQLLFWVGQKLHIDAMYVAKGGFWLLISTIAETTLSLILAVVFAHTMDKASYGIYQYILTLAGILMIFSLEDMQFAVIQSVARGHQGVIPQAFQKKLRWSALMTVAAALGALYYWSQGNNVLAFGILCIGFLQPFMASAGIYRTFFQAKKDFKHFATYKIIEDLIPGVVIVTTVLVTKNVLWVVLAYCASYACVRLLLYRRVARPLTNAPTDPQALSYGTQLSGIAIIGRLAKHIDKIIIFHYLGATELAIYAFAIAFPSYVDTILGYALPLALPKFAAQKNVLLQHTVIKKIFLVTLATIPIVVIYVVVAPVLFKLFFPQYSEAIPLSQLYAVGLLASGNLALAFLVAKKALKEQLTLKVTSTVMRTILMLAFIPFLGLWGVIVALIIDRYIYFLLSLIFVKKFKSVDE